MNQWSLRISIAGGLAIASAIGGVLVLRGDRAPGDGAARPPAEVLDPAGEPGEGAGAGPAAGTAASSAAGGPGLGTASAGTVPDRSGRTPAARGALAGGEVGREGRRGGNSAPEGIPEAAITDAILRKALRQSSAPLREALRQVLEGEEKGPLLGLLIANLTEKGTLFTADELPLLAEALKAEPGHEIQALLLAHLDRIDAPAERSAAYLAYLAESPAPSHAVEVVDRLAKLKSPEAVEGLIGILDSGGPPRARKRIVEALGEMGDPAAVRPLAGILDRSDDDGERGAALRALSAIGDRASVEAILAHAAAPGNRAALGALGTVDARKDPDSVPLLARALLDRSYTEYQVAILRKLQRDGDARVERTVQRAIDRSEEPKVLAAAADALAGFGTRDSLEYLEGKLVATADPATRRVYERALRKLASRLADSRSRG